MHGWRPISPDALIMAYELKIPIVLWFCGLCCAICVFLFLPWTFAREKMLGTKNWCLIPTVIATVCSSCLFVCFSFRIFYIALISVPLHRQRVKFKRSFSTCTVDLIYQSVFANWYFDYTTKTDAVSGCLLFICRNNLFVRRSDSWQKLDQCQTRCCEGQNGLSFSRIRCSCHYVHGYDLYPGPNGLGRRSVVER